MRHHPTLSFLGGGILAFLGIAALVVVEATDGFDRAVIQTVRAADHGDVLAFLGPTTELGGTVAVTVIALLTLLVGVAAGPWRHGAIGAGVIGLAALAVEIIKSSVARERPDLLEPILVEHGFSFPSGHASLSMVAYGILAVLVSRSFLPRTTQLVVFGAVVALVFLIGLSRVWLGVHYPSDVIAGWVAGATVVLVYASFTRGVSREPAEAAVAEDRAAPRSGRSAAG
jgi:undecaprenyl-diphosphatase